MSSGRLQVDAALEIELLPLALEFFAECLLPGIEELCLLVRSNGLVPVFALRFGASSARQIKLRCSLLQRPLEGATA